MHERFSVRFSCTSHFLAARIRIVHKSGENERECEAVSMAEKSIHSFPLEYFGFQKEKNQINWKNMENEHKQSRSYLHGKPDVSHLNSLFNYNEKTTTMIVLAVYLP